MSAKRCLDCGEQFPPHPDDGFYLADPEAVPVICRACRRERRKRELDDDRGKARR